MTQGALGLAPDEQGERMVPGSRGSQNAQLQKWMVAPGPTVLLKPQEVCMVAWSATVQSARAALRGWRQAGKHAEEERERERECACVGQRSHSERLKAGSEEAHEKYLGLH